MSFDKLECSLSFDITYQKEKALECYNVLKKYKLVYVCGETRSGKTIASLLTVFLYGAKKVLIITKKNAIQSILSDFKGFNFNYDLDAINFESIHKKQPIYDFIIIDEVHTIGVFPKPNKSQKIIKKLFHKIPCILMSGTPSIESYSQIFNQLNISAHSPFKEYINFYKWAKYYVNKKEKRISTHIITDYSDAKIKEIDEKINPYKVIMLKKGDFKPINETILTAKTPQYLIKLAKKLFKKKSLKGEGGYIIGNTAVKLQSKIQQIVNGHCIIETVDGDGFVKIFSTYKAEFIKNYFTGKKIVIMYYYKTELEILKQVFNDITTDLNTFNTTNCNIAVQQRTTEGVNLSKADAIVYYNLGFSGKDYLQSRDRMTVRGRKTNDVYYICEDYGLTLKILKTVQNKKSFNSKAFLEWQGNNQD